MPPQHPAPPVAPAVSLGQDYKLDATLATQGPVPGRQTAMNTRGHRETLAAWTWTLSEAKGVFKQERMQLTVDLGDSKGLIKEIKTPAHHSFGSPSRRASRATPSRRK